VAVYHAKAASSFVTNKLRSLPFVSSSHLRFSDALSQKKAECKESSRARSSTKAFTETREVPIDKLQQAERSVIHEGRLATVPSGNSQKMLSPPGYFTLL
jgi:hypothetical protein